MTLPEIVVDMSPNKGRFNEGQAYVAFSLVTSLEKLHIVNYSHDQIRVPKNVEEEIHCNGRQVLPELPKPMISTVDKNSNLVLAHLNVSGIYCKLLDIQCDETLWFVDIMCFNETHLCSHNAISPEMLGLTEDFEIIWKDRNQHGGGVMVLVHKSLNPRHLLTIGNMEVVVIQITVSTEQLYTVSVYWSQQYKTEPWINDVRHLLNIYKNKKMCLVGDLNEDITDVSKPIYNMFTANGFTQHVKSPTHDSGTLIDHVYTSDMLNNMINTEVLDCYCSDHDIVTCTISI